MTRTKAGLVLGGGGARGLARIGIIKKLVECQIPVHAITGASMGAIVGTAWNMPRPSGLWRRPAFCWFPNWVI